MAVDQLLAGEYFRGFVWCAELSHGAVPALPSAGCPKGTALSAAADSGGAPKDAACPGSCQHHLPKGSLQTLLVHLVLISSAWEEAF